MTAPETGRRANIAFVTPETPIDLTNCDREPIHLIGHVQPFGALLVLRGDALHVDAATMNIGEVLGVAHASLLGATAADVFGAAQAERIGRLARYVAEGAMAPVHGVATTTPAYRRVARPIALAVGTGAAQRAVHGTVRPTDGGCLIELEPALGREPMSVDEFAELVRHTVARVESATRLQDAAQAVAEEVRGVTGFDRVWVYRFHEDAHGEVIAESRDASVAESWLGLHYPASDIPAQARALFLRQTIRLIADVDYVPSPIEPARDAESGQPFDLGDCVARGVSAMHLRYLHNMGVRASMSLSLVKDGTLWGLVSCHHYAGPRVVPHDRRAACDLLAQAFSARLAASEALEGREHALRVNAVQVQLVDRLARESDLVAALVGGDPTMLDLTRADGAAVCLHGAVTTTGATPTLAQIASLVAWLDDGNADVLRTDTLGTLHAPAETWADVASGLLAVSLGGRGDWLLWFRREQRQVVAWAGDPNKPVEVSPDPADPSGQTLTRVLTPRGSFERWEQEVRGRAVPWRRAEVEAATTLRGTLVDLLLARAAQLEQLNRELARSNEELDAFTYVASHDLKEPLRGIHSYASIVREDYGDALTADGTAKLETIARLSRRLDEMVDALFHFSRVGRMELDERAVRLQDVVDDALERLVAAPGRERATVRIPRPLPTVIGDRERLAEVWFNLLSNAFKYAKPAGSTVEMGWVAPGEPVPAGGPAGAHAPFFYVKDDGIGIEPRHHETVFRLYKRLHARDAYGGGTGAGLTIVERIVARHGGRVWIESAAGAGTTVWFTLGDRETSSLATGG